MSGFRYPPTDADDRIASASVIPSTSTAPVAIATVPVNRKRGRPKGSKAATSWSRISKQDASSSADDDVDEEDGTWTSLKGKGRAVEGNEQPAGSSEIVNGSDGAVAKTTKSGRRVKKPEIFVPETGPTFHRKSKKKNATAETITNTMLLPTNCSVCSTSHTVAGNQLVLCDGCDESYHQRCHHPEIEEEIVEDEGRQWYCASCTDLVVVGKPPVTWENSVSGQGLPASQKSKYLNSLSRSALLQTLQMQLPETRNRQAIAGAQVYGRVSASDAEAGLSPNDTGGTLRSVEEAGITSKATAEERSSLVGTKATSDLKRPRASTSAKVTSSRSNSHLPSYIDMIMAALAYINEPNGSPPRMIFEWMNDTYPLMDNFRPSASQALQKAAKSGRLLKDNNLYKINTKYDGKTKPLRPARPPKKGKQHAIPSKKHTPKQKPPNAYATPLESAKGAYRSSPSLSLPDVGDDQDMLQDDAQPCGTESDPEELGDEQDYQLEGDVDGDVDGDAEEVEEDEIEIERPHDSLRRPFDSMQSKDGVEAMLEELFHSAGHSATATYAMPSLPPLQSSTVYQQFPQYHAIPQGSADLSLQFQQIFQATQNGADGYAPPSTSECSRPIGSQYGSLQLPSQNGQPITSLYERQSGNSQSNLDPSLPGV